MTKNVREFFAKSGDYVKDLNLKEKTSSIFKKTKVKRDFDKEIFELALSKISANRSCRKFSKKKFEFKIVYDIIEAALCGPCAGGIQNIYVIAIEDEHHRHKLAKIHGEQTWAGEAPVMLAVISDKSEMNKLFPHDADNLSLQNSTVVSTSIVNLLALTNLSCCMVRAGSNDETCAVLGVDSSMSVDCLIPIGYSEYKPPFSDRLPTGARFYFESFGNNDRGGGGHH